MFMCDTCGFAREKPGMCPFCQVVLTSYTKEEEREYQVNMEEAMRSMSSLKWYL